MPAQKWMWKCRRDSVVFQAEKQQLDIEVTDGNYEAHYSMDKPKFKELVNACGVLFDNDYKSTMERVKAEGQFENFVDSVRTSGTVQFVWY